MLRRYIELVCIGVIILAAVIVGAYYYLYQQQQNTRTNLELTQQKLTELEPVQTRAEGLSISINTISNLISQDIRFSAMLTQIGGLMPQGTVLTGLKFSIGDKAAPLVISAQVDTEEKAAVLRNNLAQSSLFESANIKSITRNDTEKTLVSSDSTSAIDEKLQSSAYPYTAVIETYFKGAAKAKVEKKT